MRIKSKKRDTVTRTQSTPHFPRGSPANSELANAAGEGAVGGQRNATSHTGQPISLRATSTSTGQGRERSDSITSSVAMPMERSGSVPTYFLKVHLYSTLEVRHTTTISVPVTMLLSDVHELVCRKRKIDPKDYVLRMPDMKTDVPLDQSLESLQGVSELCLLKKTAGVSGKYHNRDFLMFVTMILLMYFLFDFSGRHFFAATWRSGGILGSQHSSTDLHVFK